MISFLRRHTTCLSALILLQLMVEVLCHSSQEQLQPNTSVRPTFRYYIFSEQCYHTFFSEQNFFHMDCLKLTISKTLSYGIIVGATIVKVPQILKIVKNRSTFGVSFESVILEQINQIAALAYNMYRNNPFSIYGEVLFITFQMLAIHLLFIVFDKENRLKAALLYPPILGFFLIGYFPEWDLFPSYIFEHMILIMMTLFAAARLTQIYQIHKIKSTGSVSLITYGLSTLGNVARVATALIEVRDDWKLILSHFICFLLNGYITLCFFIFKEKKEEIDSKKQSKEKKDK